MKLVFESKLSRGSHDFSAQLNHSYPENHKIFKILIAPSPYSIATKFTHTEFEMKKIFIARILKLCSTRAKFQNT